MEKKKRRTDPGAAKRVLRRDGVCLYGLISQDGCQGALDPHHIIYVSQGGDDTDENLITLCRRHHDQVHAHIIHPEELKQILGQFYGYGL